MESICSCRMLRKSMLNNGKSMANEKGKKSCRHLIQKFGLVKKMFISVTLEMAVYLPK